MQNQKKLTVAITIVFLLVPVLSSFISTVHLISFFELGNYTWMSILLAICYEIGSITSFITPFILTKINKNLLWSIFIILVVLQIFGNVYFSFNYINHQLITNPLWLTSFQEFLAYFVGSDIALIKIIIASLIGIPIPLISLFFLKSLMEYAKPDGEVINDAQLQPNKNDQIELDIVSTSDNNSEKRISSVVGNHEFKK